MSGTTKIRLLSHHLRSALRGSDLDFTSVRIPVAAFYLAVPMVVEMLMESAFAVVDIFFVSKLGTAEVAAVGLTESLLTVLYSVAVGISTAGTAVVSRRIGEKNHDAAAVGAFQTLWISLWLSVILALLGGFFAKDLLELMGADEHTANIGTPYARILFFSNASILFLFVINGIYRGAGDASRAMRALWLANGLNIILDPLLIFGIGSIPGMGLEGAAWATFTGRAIAVVYQFYHLFKGTSTIVLLRKHFILAWQSLLKIFKIACGGMGQFLIEGVAWIALARIVAFAGNEALAGYTIAIRIIIFTLLPAFGIANAAATLVGQNLGAGSAERAEKAAWFCAKYNAWFLGICSLLFLLFGHLLLQLFTSDQQVIDYGSLAIRIITLGYVFFAVGMVLIQSINGAGDTRTPMLVNISLFWLIEIPLAYVLAVALNWGATGVFVSIALAHSLHAVVCTYIFRLGRWKTIQV